jgi:hypothetical protein
MDFPLQLVATNELFYQFNDLDWGPEAGIEQNRFFIGVGADTAIKGVRVDAGYMNVLFPDRIHARTEVIDFITTPEGAWINLFGVWTPVDRDRIPVTAFSRGTVSTSVTAPSRSSRSPRCSLRSTTPPARRCLTRCLRSAR